MTRLAPDRSADETPSDPASVRPPTRAAVIGPIRLRLQVMNGGDGAMGPGKAALLEAIDRLGSISGAGRVLEISYRRCWILVDEMNRTWRQPLVESHRGGRDRGARLTPLGQEVLTAFRGLEARLTAEIAAAPEADELRARLADPPA